MVLPLPLALPKHFSASHPFNCNVKLKEISFDSLKPCLVGKMVKVKCNKVAASATGTRMCRNRENQVIVRRSGNYEASIWKHDFVQSLTTDFMVHGEEYRRELNGLKMEVRNMMMNQIIDEEALKQLEFIDTLERLGISYNFESEIKAMLDRIMDGGHYYTHLNNWKNNNLYATSLQFRLFRQHGFHISQAIRYVFMNKDINESRGSVAKMSDVFNSFKDEAGNFKISSCEGEDINGILSLYEASFLSMEGETILDEARNFTVKYLEKYIKSSKDELKSAIVMHALELPLHWRMPRLEARWFIDIYEKSEGMNLILLRIAKLDFNMLQSIHQQDLKYTSSWWKSTGLGEKLSFARDRWMENFFLTIGIQFQPEFGYCRRVITKVNAFVTTIDDIYDVYGTLDELELFTNVVERWDPAAVDELPDYMKICFLALHNSINEMAFDIMREQGINVIQYLKKEWANLCKSYMVEARWYHSGYKPTLQEYLENAWISISGPLVLIHAYMSVTSPLIKENLETCFNEYADIIRWASIIVRLADDLGTSSEELKRGDVPKSIQCYMNETGASEDVARAYIRHLINETWKKLNKAEAENSMFSQLFVNISKNTARMAQCIYEHGDGYGLMNQETKHRMQYLLIQPISISLDN